MFPIPRKTAKRRNAVAPGFHHGEMESGGVGTIPLGSQAGPGRRRKELNMIPDLFHYYNLLLSHSTTPVALQGKSEKISKALSPPQWGWFSPINVQDILTTDLHEGQPG